jgi:LPS export ABC transporter protein LptC
MKLLVASVACLATMTLAACKKSTNPPVVGGPTLADSAEQIIIDGRTLLTNRGVQRGELFSDTIFVFTDQTVFALRKVRATFNTETGAPNGTLRGDRGRYDRRTQILEGFGNVVVTSTDGRRLLSPHLRYAQMRNEISSDSAFTFFRGKDVQQGIGFVSDPNITVFKCLRACRVAADVPLNAFPNP